VCRQLSPQWLRNLRILWNSEHISYTACSFVLSDTCYLHVIVVWQTSVRWKQDKLQKCPSPHGYPEWRLARWSKTVANPHCKNWLLRESCIARSWTSDTTTVETVSCLSEFLKNHRLSTCLRPGSNCVMGNATICAVNYTLEWSSAR
jgi:hypothetical protein